MTPIELRPSLLAALETVGKVLGAVAAFVLPVLVPAIILGEAVAAGALFAFTQTVSLYPALIAALFPAINLAFTRYDVDEDGIRIRTQFLQKTEKRVSWEKITAVRHRRTVLDVATGLERLDVVAYGERGATLHLVGLRNAAPVRDLIAQRMLESASVDALLRGD